MVNARVKKREAIVKVAQAAMIIAVMLVLDLTNLGMIITPTVAITTYHIPVIVGAIIMGPYYGMLFGGFFGALSIYAASTRGVSIADLAFSPFYSGDPVSSLIMSVGVRILIGLVASLVFRCLTKHNINSIVSCVIAAILATLTNTVGVLTCLWLLFPELSLTFKTVLKIIITVNCFLEVVLAVIFSLAFAKALPALRKYMNK